MKKLTTFLVTLLFSTAFVNAQNCSFTVEPGINSGEYVFTGPEELANQQDLLTFYWGFENGATFTTGYNVTHNYSQSMIDVVTLIVVNNIPDSSIVCESSLTITAIADSSNDCNYVMDIAVSPANPFEVTFSIPGANDSVLWNFGDGFEDNSGTNQVSHVYNGPGQYLVCASILTALGEPCFLCFQLDIEGNNQLPDCNASFWASTSALTGYFIPEGYYYATNYNYSWDFGDGETSSEMYPYHIYDTEGTYNVCLTVSDADGLCSDSYCQNVFIPSENTFPIDSLCFADFVITQDNPFEVIVVNGSTGNNLDFTWTLTGGGISITSTGAFPTIEVENTGAFEFCLTVSDEFCSATYCDSIVVGENGIIGGKVSSAGFTINVMSPQAATDFPLAVENKEEILFSVYPNPFSNLLNIRTINSEAVSYEITSIDGRRFSQGNISGENQTINTSELNSGLYMLSISDKSGNRQIQKIIKK
jgi:PKD repeat protein